MKEQDEILRRLEKILIPLFRHSVRFRIAMVLNNSDKPLSFSEVMNSVGIVLSTPVLSYHLRALEAADLIKNIRELDTHTGKARSSFYELTERGKVIINIFLEAIEGIP